MLGESNVFEKLSLTAYLARADLSELNQGKSRMAWLQQARPSQVCHLGIPDWEIALFMCGRGWGKTRTGAEDSWMYAHANPKSRLAVVAPTWADARDTCFEGTTGILGVTPKELITSYNRTLLEVNFTNGSKIKGFSAQEPDRLRGPQHHRAWCDELAAWDSPQDVMDQVKFGLRLGERPRILITTTPRPLPIIKKLVEESQQSNKVLLISGSTFDNSENLAPTFLDAMQDKYANTRLGRQELYAEVLSDVQGALWSFELLNRQRIAKELLPTFSRVVIGLDPAMTATGESDETGIVVAALGVNGVAYILADHSGRHAVQQWTGIISELYKKYSADAVIAEVNNGGDLVEKVLQQQNSFMRVKSVRASKGKIARAEPIVMQYERARVFHVGYHALLEQQMTEYVLGAPKSPDRLDALVWALTDLFENKDISNAYKLIRG